MFARVLEKLGKSWNFILTFSRTGKRLQVLENPENPWNLLYSSNKVFTICALIIVSRPVGELILKSWDREGLRWSPWKSIWVLENPWICFWKGCEPCMPQYRVRSWKTTLFGKKKINRHVVWLSRTASGEESLHKAINRIMMCESTPLG